MSNFNQTLETTLKQQLDFIDNEGDLYKAKVIDSAWKVDPKLIELLLENEQIKFKFFTEIKGHWVFNVALFVAYIQDKNFLNDSWTNYKNKIGLMDGNKFLNQKNDVALVWPFKDCVLEGGQTTEENGRKEIFFNEILAQDEIDVLLDPKVLTNSKKYTKDGKQALDGFTRDQNGTIKDNLIIKGNNLLALHTLKTQFSGKVKLIYIDPPYNTGNDGFRYNDNFNHSTWLTFMKNRLEVARELLRDDGVIFVQCDDNEQAYLKVLMDEIFGRENFVSNIIHNNKYTISNDSKWTSKQCEFIAVFAKKKERLIFNLLDRTEEMDNAYKNPDNDPRGNYKLTPLHAKSGTENGKYEVVFKNGITWQAPDGRFPRYAKKKLIELDKDNRIYFGKDGKGSPNVKTFLSEVKDGKGIGTFWSFKDAGSSHQANEELAQLFGKGIFGNPKPENLLKMIIQISTNPGDILLDYHLGSGTTAAVAHKMGRQYIGIEQMDYIETIAVERLKKVIGKGVKSKDLIEDNVCEDFDTGGISKAVNWQGGGSFVYFELKKLQEAFMELIQEAKTTEELEKIWEQMKEKSFLDWMIDLRGEIGAMKDWKDLTLEKQKTALCLCLDKNQMYVNYSEIDDTQFECTEEEKRVSGEFYGF